VKFSAFEVPPPGAGLVTVTGTVPAEAMAAAGMAAVNCVALTNVVVRVVPPKLTNEVDTKFVPLTVRVKAEPPVAALFGEMEVIDGTRLPTVVKLTVFEVPPPGAGFVTVTATIPAAAMAAAGIDAVNCVELTKLAAYDVPPKLTAAAETKFVPLTVSVKPAALPATALVGEIAVIVGTGLPPPPVEAVPPPHPARNNRITIPEITLPLVSTR
jgi:hypothetical protein